MILGEIRKILRNKMFIVIVAVILLIDMMTIIYSLGEKNKAYVEYRNNEQSQYIETYKTFINEMDERGKLLLSTLDDEDDAYYKRNVDKMIADYEKLSNVSIDKVYNWGVEKYADFTYGIFFCIVFAFVCMEYMYISERKSGMINILRATKNGRCKMILSKWTGFIVMVILFAFVQEVMVIVFDSAMYSMGNLNSSVQSLQIFRDCSYNLSMLMAIVISILNHVIIAMVVGSVIFFGMVTINNRLLESALPIVFLGFEFLSAKDSPVNIFYSWDMRNVIGVYQNLNILGFPIDKNLVAFAVALAVIVFATLVGGMIFSFRYISELKSYFQFISDAIRQVISRLLHVENMYINEFYKLLILQKKWILVLALCAGIAGLYKEYLPSTTYQSAYEAVYHMHLSNIHGKVDDETTAYIEKEKQYIESVEKQIESAMANGNGALVAEVQSELESTKKAFERLNRQYEKLSAYNGTTYLIDEMNLDSIIKKYRNDIMIFMLSAIVLVLCISGLYGSKDENQTKLLVQTSKNGRERLMNVKRRCTIICGVLVYAVSLIPSIAGYMNILEFDELGQKVNLLYEPQIEWGISLFMFLLIINSIRGILYLFLAIATTIMAKKTSNEFVVSVFVTTIVIVIALILYFSKTNITMILINVVNGGR